MRLQIGYKFIIGCVAVVAVVTFAPDFVRLLGYSSEGSRLFSVSMALTVGLVLGWLFSIRFSGRVGVLVKSAKAISRGDLSQDASLKSSRFSDEINDLGDSIEIMRKNLMELVSHIRCSSTDVTTSSGDIKRSASEISISVREVASAILEIAKAAEKQAGMLDKG